MSQGEKRSIGFIRCAAIAVVAASLIFACDARAHDPYCHGFGHGWGGGYPDGHWGVPFIGAPIYYGGNYGSFYGSTWSSYGWGLGGYGGASFYSGTYPVYPLMIDPVYPTVPAVRMPTQEGWPPQHVWDVLNQQQEGIIANDPAVPWNEPAPRPDLDALRFMPPSSPEAIIASQGHQDEGDREFQQFRIGRATEEYRDAIAAAPERPEPYFRLAVTLAARRDFLEAVNVLERLLVIDPDWPAHGTQLAEMFAPGDELPKMQIKQRVADWVLEDVRDPDRLFLLGVMLYFDGDPDSARTLLETAALVEGDAEHLTPFLRQLAPEPVIPAAGLEADDPLLAPVEGPPPVLAPVPVPAPLPREDEPVGPRFGP